MTLVLEGYQRIRKRANLQALDLNDQKNSSESEANGSVESAESDISQLTMQVEQKPVDTVSEDDHEPVVASKDTLRGQSKDLSAIQEMQFTQREYLTILTLSRMLKDDATQSGLASLLLVHTVLLKNLSLSRRRPPATLSDKRLGGQLSSFISKFSSIAAFILMQDQWTQSKDVNTLECDVADLIDGRLLHLLSTLNHQDIITGALLSSFDQFAHALGELSGVKIRLGSGDNSPQQQVVKSNGVATDKLSILPFSNSTFDKHLVSVHIAVEERIADRQMGRIHKEITHWHNAKRPLIVKVVAAVDPRQAKRIMRRNDFFMAEMQAYAASLTNATGKSLEPEIVTVSDKSTVKAVNKKEVKPDEEPGSTTQGSNSRKGKDTSKKGSAKQALLKNIAMGKAVKDKENVDKIFSAWRIVRTDLAAEKSLRNQYFRMVAYLDNLPDAKRIILKPEVLWNVLCILLTVYGIFSKKKDSEHVLERYGTVALLFDTARTLTKTEGLTKTISTQLQTVIDVLRLPRITIPMPTTDRELTYDPKVRVTGRDDLDIGLQSHDFQLRHLGPYMDRNLDSAPDSRVPFEPDGWQRKVLDELDEDHSVFVVAPTSAGKTFISFYAMERILRANDDGVLGKFVISEIDGFTINKCCSVCCSYESIGQSNCSRDPSTIPQDIQVRWQVRLGHSH